MAAGALRAIDEVRGMGEGIHRVSGFGDNAFLRALTGGIPTVHYLSLIHISRRRP